MGASGFVRVNCPFCADEVGKEDRKQCLSFRASSGFYVCWRCGTKGRLDGFEDADDFMHEEPGAQLEGIEPPEGFYELMGDDARGSLTAQPAMEYLARRGLTDERVMFESRLGFCADGKYAGRIVVPVIAPDGASWWGWVARDYTGRPRNHRNYSNAPGMSLGATGRLFNQAALNAPSPGPVFVVEGCFDALALWPDAVAVLGKPTEAQERALALATRPVVVALDGDAWLESERLATFLKLRGKLNVGWVKLPPTKDPDDVPRDWLMAEARKSLEA